MGQVWIMFRAGLGGVCGMFGDCLGQQIVRNINYKDRSHCSESEGTLQDAGFLGGAAPRDHMERKWCGPWESLVSCAHA